MIRTGLFRFVRHEEVEAHHRRGWMVVADLGGVHGAWSVLCWACDCPVFRSLATDAAEPRPEIQDVAERVGYQHAALTVQACQTGSGSGSPTSWNSGHGSPHVAGRS